MEANRIDEEAPSGEAARSEGGRCPSCGAKGKKVEHVTVRALVARHVPENAGGFRFCATPDCDTAYFEAATGARFSKTDVKVPVFQKVAGSERPVCYCFGRSVADIEADVRRTGTSTIPDDIAEKCRQGLDRCEELNPQGTCCLGNVRTVLKEAQEKRGVSAASRETDDRCRVEKANPMRSISKTTNPEGPAPSSGIMREDHSARISLAASMSSIVAAIAASACCVGPLVFALLGIGGAGLLVKFEPYRPIFTVVTLALLGAGFYFTYRKPKAAAAGQGDACGCERPKANRAGRIMLWFAAVLVAVFLVFPYVVPVLFG